MAKVTKAPYGVCGLLIHGTNRQYKDNRDPHCHIACQGHRLTISLIENDLKIISGKGELDASKEEEILEWVHSNFSSFMEIWNTNSNE